MNSNGPYSAQGLAAPAWPIDQTSPVAQAKGTRCDVVTTWRPHTRRRGGAPIEGVAVAGAGVRLHV
jgi:D-arabinose 1-dehydrogenase-like Zn-dependent alcohol dehydrogenase